MRLSGEELRLFMGACDDRENIHAQELMNVFGVESGTEVLRAVHHAPIGIFIDVVSHIWYAILHEASRVDPHWGETLERMLA